jgi:hypothetical protein
MAEFIAILNGWANLIKDAFGKLNEEQKALSKKRLSICDTCQIRSGNICNPKRMERHIETGALSRGCGCNIAAKSMVKHAKCPVGKW